MFTIGLFLNVAVLSLLCWALFSLAIYALPAFVGVSAFFALHAAGQGEIFAAIGGVLAGGATWGLGKAAFALTRSATICCMGSLPSGRQLTFGGRSSA
jgi:hypothetical protein